VLPTEKKRSRLNFAVIGFVLFLLVLFMAFGWVGYWAYTLNTELISTQQQLVALQAKHSQLQADYTTLTGEKDKLNVDLIQSTADLEKANSDLASTQADLSQSKQNGDKLQTKIKKASDLVEILFVTATLDEESDIFKIDRLITESNNQELIQQWDTFTGNPSDNAFGEFIDYVILEARNSLK
jgi:cell division protein FtsB